jgi:cyclic pyranopterin monophosphate synthase
MVNITHKSNTLRKAIATAIVKVSRQETIDAIKNKEVPKGDVFEFSRAAGLLAVKKTSDVIPDCHPLPVEYTAISFEIKELAIIIRVEVHTIYKTGVEVEAMHGVAITALTIYDMLKPIDKKIEISNIQLEYKKGGKSDFNNQSAVDIRCAVIVCSDSTSAGTRQDLSGKAVIEKLKQYSLSVSCYEIIPDDSEIIKKKALELTAQNYQLLLFTGGTGLSQRDVTPEAIRPLLDREIPGIMETARQYGQQRTPYAMLSRGVAGFIKNTLVLTLPGSTSGAEETIDSIFPYVLHVFKVAKGMQHNDNNL